MRGWMLRLHSCHDSRGVGPSVAERATRRFLSGFMPVHVTCYEASQPRATDGKSRPA